MHLRALLSKRGTVFRQGILHVVIIPVISSSLSAHMLRADLGGPASLHHSHRKQLYCLLGAELKVPSIWTICALEPRINQPTPAYPSN